MSGNFVESIRQLFGQLDTLEFKGHKGRINSLKWSPDGRRLASAAFDGSCRVWSIDLITGKTKKMIELKGHKSSVNHVCWHPTEADILATASSDKTVNIWDTNNSQPIASVLTGGENINLTFSPDGRYLVTSTRNDIVIVIERNSSKIIHQMKFETEINEIAWKLDKYLFLATGTGAINVLSFPAMELVYCFDANTGNCYCIDFDPTDRYFAVGGADAVVTLWDSQDYICHKSFARLEWPVRTLSFSHDGQMIASASEDHFIDLSHIDTGEAVFQIKSNCPTNTITWHPSKHLLAFAGDDNERYLVLCAMEIDIDVNEWSYKAEGNRHLILKYSGRNKIFQNKVLRLRKYLEEDLLSFSHGQRFDFGVRMISRLFGSQYNPQHSVIELNESTLRQIRRGISAQRGSEIGQLCSSAILLEDLTISSDLPCFSIEIKPKWGYNPYPNGECRYCRQQKLKKDEGKIIKLSCFCPLDLFSGDYPRIRKAVSSLLDVPQNNFAAYINGVRVEETNLSHLHKNLGLNDNDEMLECISRSLYADSELFRLLKIHQQKLDGFLDRQFSELEADYILPYLSCIDLWEIVLQNYCGDATAASVEEKFIRYLLSITLKDISIFLSFRKDEISQKFKGIGGLKVIDVDMKSPHKLDHYSMLSNKLALFDSAKICH